MPKKKITKHTGDKLKTTERKTLFCKECNIVTVSVSSDICSVICSYCVQRLAAPPENMKRKSENERFPRGWHFKQRYIHTDGRVFCRGVEIDEKAMPTEPTPKKIDKKVINKKTRKTRK
jgi:hypothetical protein